MPVAIGDAFRYITTTGTNVGESDATLIAPDVNGTLTIAGGFGITLTADATNRKITITNTGNGTGALTTITTQNSAGTYYPIFTRAPLAGDFNPNSGTYQMSTMYYETTTDPLTYNPGSGLLSVVGLSVSGHATIEGVTTTGATGTGNLVFSSSPTFTTGITLAYDPIALGNNAGKTSQGSYSVAVGTNAGQTSQGGTAVAVGYNAGEYNQFANAVAIGWNAGKTSQGNSSIAIGTDAGNGSQGQYAIAIGASAGIGGTNAQADNTIILNASGLELDGVASQTNSFYVAPIRNTTSTSGILQYNSTTKEVTYSSSINPSTVNGMTISSSTGTFTLANSKTFTVNNTITLSGTDSTTITLPSTSGTVPLNNQTFYLGTTSVAINRSSANLALTGISSVAFPGSTSGTAILQATATAGTPTLSLPITTGTLISTGDSATVSNTMLANNSVTFGSTTVALGATSTSLAGLTSIDGTTGLTSAFATPNGTVALLGAATTLNFANTATTVSEYAAVTSLAIGNTATAAQTVNMFTASTGASTYNIATGATTNGTTKAINIGTGGVSGSTTNITIGSSNGGTTTVKGTLSFAGSTSGTVKFVAPATAGTASYTLPSAYPGTAGFALVSDLSGTLSWAAAGAVISTDTTDTVLYPTMTTLSSGNFTAAKVNTSFTYNATNGTLSATTLSGTLANSLTINGTVYNNSSAVSLTIPAGPTGPAGPSTYDLFQFVNGKPLATEVLMRAIAVRAYTIAANFAGCLAYCTTGAASAQTINILKNGATIGTITFAISSTSGTFAGSSSGVTMNIGDQLQVQMASGASQDSSFSDLAFTIKGTSS